VWKVRACSGENLGFEARVRCDVVGLRLEKVSLHCLRSEVGDLCIDGVVTVKCSAQPDVED
jgi:hypothetical protein